MTHSNQWASELIKVESECLDDWVLFDTEIREMYGDLDRQLDTSTHACLEIVQGASDANETVEAYSNRMRSMWREAGWNAGSTDVQRVLYDMVWAGLRPGIKARIEPFAREDGRFASIDELFKKAQDVKIRSNCDKRAGTTQNQPAATAEKGHSNNGSNNGGKNHGNHGSKDCRKRPYHDTPSQTCTPSTPSRIYSHNYIHSNLPPAPWADRERRDKHREKGLCLRCGGDHKTFLCPKFSRADIPPTRKYDNRHNCHDRHNRHNLQNRDKRQISAADTTQGAKK
jgi:hypothetical protein